MSEQLTGCHPPHLLLHRLHPSPVLYCESQRQPGRVSAVCLCVCARVCTLCMCVAADQRQLGGGGGRWYLVPPPTSPPLCICPSQFEQRGFFFCLPPSSSSLLPTHWFRESERGREKEKERERERERYTAITSKRAQLFCYSGVNQVDAYCCRYGFVCACVCVRDIVSRVGECGVVEWLFCFVVGISRVSNQCERYVKLLVSASVVNSCWCCLSEG